MLPGDARLAVTAEEAKAYNAMAIRNATIEECARVVEALHCERFIDGHYEIVEAIRKLKDVK